MPDYGNMDLTQFMPGVIKEKKVPVTPLPAVAPEPVDMSASVNAREPGYADMDLTKFMPEQAPPAPGTLDTYQAVAKTSTPETEAEIQSIFGETGIPQSIIRDNIEASRHRAEYSTLVANSAGSPKLLGFLQDPKNLAAVRGDVEPLSIVEATLAHQIKTGAIETVEDIPAGFRRGQDVVTRGQLYSELSNAIITGADQVDIQERIDTFEAAAETTQSKGGYLESASEMLPMMGQAILAGQKEGVKYATVGAAGSLITGGVTAPAAAAVMYGAGTTVGAVNEIFSLERGNALAEFLEIKDETGAPLDPMVANMAAIGVGGINAGLEFIGLQKLSKIIPGGEKLVGSLTRSAVTKALKDPSVRRTLMDLGRRYAAGVTTETITEMGQEIVNILGAAAAKAVSDQDFGPDNIFSPENMSRVMEAGEMAFKATVVLGGAGAGVSAVREVRQVDKQIVEQAAFEEFHAELDEAIAGTQTAEQNPAIMEKFLNETMGLKDQDAFVDGEVLLELNQVNPELMDEIVAEMDAPKEKILEAAAQGRPVRINMGAYHSRLSPEAKAALMNGLKATPGSYSASQIDEGSAQSTDNFEEQFNGFVVENEAIATEISRIEQENVAAGIDSRVAAQTAQIAARVAMSWADNSANGNAAAILNKMKFVPGVRQDIADLDGVTYDQQTGQLQTDTPEFKNWFGESKVVDESGAPLTVYHGTDAEFDAFDLSRFGGTDEGFLGSGVYLSSDQIFAQEYGEILIEAHVSLQNPFEFDDPYAFGGVNPDKIRNMIGLPKSATAAQVTDQLVAMGHDGVIVNETQDEGPPVRGVEIVVFELTQIKSATANVGTFDPADPNIYQQAAAAQMQDVFYSQLKKSVTDIQQKKAPGPQWSAMLKKLPIKKEELEWSGVIPWLDSKRGKVTKAELLGYLEQNQVIIEDVVKRKLTSTDLDRITDLEIEKNGLQSDYNSMMKTGLAVEDADRINNRIVEIDNELVILEDLTKFSQYQLPGGKNYKEVLLTLPEQKIKSQSEYFKEIIRIKEKYSITGRFPTNAGLYAALRAKATKQEMQTVIDLKNKQHEGAAAAAAARYLSPHFDEPNILAHVRTSEREVAGKKVLHIEEIQSDWHQEGRKKGYKTGKLPEGEVYQDVEDQNKWRLKSITDEDVWFYSKEAAETNYFERETSVPDAPFKKSWPLLAIKRMVRYAAENGFDTIAWTPGELQAERYDLSKQVDFIDVDPMEGGRYAYIRLSDNTDMSLNIDDYGIVTDSSPSSFVDKSVDDVVGKEIAEKIMNVEEETKLSGDDLKVGGEGMKAFYDKILPSEVKKFFGKKAWGKPEIGEIEIETEKQIKTEADSFLDPEYGKTTQKVALHSLEITPEMKAKALTEGMPLFQGAVKPRGSVQMFQDSYIINLFENANESTPFHELGHVFLAEMRNITASGAASEQLIKDMASIESWLNTLDDPEVFEEQYKLYKPLGFEGRTLESLNPSERALALETAKHEYFARGFESYLMEGKAPVPELIPAFRRFTRWLKSIYKHISALDVKLTAPVRDIFDRMLQSEFEVEGAMNAAGLTPMTTAELDALGVLPEDRDYLKRLYQDAQTEAENRLTRARVKGVKNLRPEWEEAADDSIQRDMLNATVHRLKKGQGIDRQTAVEIWGRAVIDRMPKGLKKIFKKGGMIPDEVAYEEGYKTAEDMFNALEAWEPESVQKRRFIAQRELEYQNSLNPEDFMLDTTQFAEYLGIIGNYTSGKMGEAAQLEERLAGIKGGRKVMARSAFKKYAKTIIRDMPVRDAIRAELFTAAMKRASQSEAAAIKRGDWAAAQQANEQMRLNFEMARESRRIRTEKEKHERMAKRLKKAKPDKVSPEYLGAALKLAQRFGLVKLGEAYTPILGKAGDVKSLLVDNSDVMGPDEYGFSTELLEGTAPFDYRDLNIDELTEVATLIKALVKKGRDKINPKLTSIDTTMDEAREKLTAAAGELKNKTKWAKRGRTFFGMDPTAWLRSMQNRTRSLYADTYQLWAMLRILDGFTYYGKDKKRGPFEKFFRDNLENAYAKKSDDTAKYEPLVKAAVQKLFKRGTDRRKMTMWLNDQIPVPVPKNMINDGRQWDFEAVAAVAVNMGNESNLARLKDGYGWTDEQLNSVVSILSDEEWDAIQELWDVFEQMRPEFFKASERIHGVAPPLIVPRPFTTPTGKVLKGGYAPAVYDRSNVRAAELDEKALLRESANAGHQRPAVNARATKSRAVTAGGMPIRLDLSGVARQFDYNLQYTAFAETIRDIARILNDQEVADTIAAKVGEDWLPAMRIIMSNVANPGVDSTANAATRVLKSLGTGASRFILGGNRSVGIKQVFSLPAVYVEGGAWFRGFRQVIRNPYQAWQDMLEASPNMRTRMVGRKLDREVAVQRKKLIARNDLAGVPAEVIDALLFAYIRFFDALATFPAWYGTKQKMERKYGPGARAIRETDKIIFDTQPISREMDLSRMQLDRNALSRLMTFFSGFTMKFENRKRVYVRGFLEGKIPLKQFMFHVMLERLMPPMLMNLLFTLGAGDDPEPDDIFWDVLMYQVIGFPIVRELSVFAANAVRQGYDEEFRSFSAFGTPIGAIPKAFEWNMNTISRWVRGEEDDKEAAVAAVDLFLATKGVPAVKIVKDFQESARQFDQSDGWDRWFKLLFKPDPKERE